jgi:hypothetical protein
MTNIHMQALAVLSPNSQPPEVAKPKTLYLDESGQYSYTRLPASTSTSSEAEGKINVQSITLKNSISSVPVVWQSELLSDYQELGEALSELKELDEDDEWKIDAPVYDAARSIAFVLMTNSIPAPQILHHGSTSVVFNWSNKVNNLYLTITSDKLSALISSPARIKRRIEFTGQVLQNPISAIRYLQSDYLERPIISTVTPSSDLAESAR